MNFLQIWSLEGYTWSNDGIRANLSGDIGLNQEYTCHLPIIGPDGNDYSINLSYYRQQ